MPPSTETPPRPVPDFSLTFDPSLEGFNKPARQWLDDNEKHWDGLASGAITFNQQNRVLLVQRASHDSMPDKWETPGGAVDWEDPTVLHACARELWEEAGLVATRIKHLVSEGPGKEEGSVFTNRYGTRFFCRFAFEVEVEDCESVRLDPEEHQDYLWASEEEVRSGVVGGRKVPITTRQMRNLILEAFRLRAEKPSEVSKEDSTAGRKE